MPRYHNIDGVRVQFTSAEETAENAEVVASEACAPARAAAKVQDNRRSAYQIESDHLHLEEERGEVPAGTWLSKVNEIKTRYPKSE